MRFSICFILLLLPATLLTAQQSQHEWGITLGPNIAAVKYGANDGDASLKKATPGVHIGFTYQYHLSENIRLRTGAEFDQKGFRVSGFYGSPPSKQTL